MAHEREGWVDSAKGIAIILVVLFHAIIFPAAVGLAWLWPTPALVLDTLRMPLFLFTAGLFASRAISLDLRALFWSRVARLLWVYVLWSIIWAIAFQFIPVTGSDEPSFWIDLLLFPVWPNASTWFVYGLAIYFIVAWLLKRLPIWAQLVIAGLISVAFGTQWIDTGNGSIDKIGTYFLYFLVAVHVSGWARGVAPRIRPWQMVVAFVAYVVVATVTAKFDLLNLPFIRIVVSVLAILAGVSIAVTINRWRAFGWLAGLGQRTLQVYLIHFYPILIITAIMTPYALTLKPLGPVIPLALTVIAITVALLVHRLTRRVTWLYDLPSPIKRYSLTQVQR
jgi:uncharacterized membrane protein YcfT